MERGTAEIQEEIVALREGCWCGGARMRSDVKRWSLATVFTRSPSILVVHSIGDKGRLRTCVQLGSC